MDENPSHEWFWEGHGFSRAAAGQQKRGPLRAGRLRFS